MAIRLTCSWCRTVNECPGTGSVFCRKCSHRADVSRESCDCLMCQKLPDVLSPIPLPEEITIEALDLPPSVDALLGVRAGFPDGCDVVSTYTDNPQLVTRADAHGLHVEVQDEESCGDWCHVRLSLSHLMNLLPALVNAMTPEQKAALFSMLAESE